MKNCKGFLCIFHLYFLSFFFLSKSVFSLWVQVTVVYPEGATVCRHSLTYTIPVFWKIQCTSNLVQVLMEYTYDQLCRHIEGSSVLIQTPTHWNLIGHSTTVIQPVLSPNSIIPAPLSHWTFNSTRRNFVCVLKMLLFNFFFIFFCNCGIWNCGTLNWISQVVSVYLVFIR